MMKIKAGVVPAVMVTMMAMLVVIMSSMMMNLAIITI